jgi:hypothetical protein
MKNYLIPNKGNKYNPHVFKPKNMLIVFLFALIVTVSSFLGSFVIKSSGLLASIQSAFLVDLANRDRVEENVSVLTINPILVEAAQKKANDMVAKSYFAHTSPEGLTPWHWFKQSKYEYIFAGENLAVNFSESVDVHKAWIASPTHKQNIMDKRFTEIGIATADGFYKGRKATFVVQMFGKPRSSLLPSSASKATNKETIPLVLSGPDESSSPQDQKVFGAQDGISSFATETNIIERVAVSPLSVGRTIIGIMIGLLVLALVFRLVIEFKRHHIGKVILLLILITALSLLLYTQKHLVFDTVIPEEDGTVLIEA